MENLENAHSLLEENITSIYTVSEWASICGFESIKKFSRVYRKKFGLRPKEKLQEARIQKIKEYMYSYPDEKNYCIAIEFGFSDEQGLYKFFKRHLGLTPTECRKRLVKKAIKKFEKDELSFDFSFNHKTKKNFTMKHLKTFFIIVIAIILCGVELSFVFNSVTPDKANSFFIDVKFINELNAEGLRGDKTCSSVSGCTGAASCGEDGVVLGGCVINCESGPTIICKERPELL